MPQYKLTYFPFRAKGENVRQMFALAGVEYEDVRIPMADWPNVKDKMPFGKLPVLEVDGKQLAQSIAINRHVARTLGFTGADEWEASQIDALVDQFSDGFDFFGKLNPFFRTAAGFEEGDKDQLYVDLVEPTRDSFLPIVTRYLKESKSGFLVGDKVSWADTLISEHIASMEDIHPGYAEKYPEVLAHMVKIRSIPALKKWIETRPVSPV